MGLAPSKLKELSAAAGIGEVDFDLAISELTEYGLVGTGPMEAFDNPPGSLVLVIGLYSKNEYAYLNEKGYKEANRLGLGNQDSRGWPKPFSERKAAVVHGDQYNTYGPVGAIGQNAVGTVNTFQECWQRMESGVDLARLATELSVLRCELVKTAVTAEDYVQVGALAQAECEAGSSNGPGVLKKLANIGKAVLETAERIGTDLAAKVIVEAGKG